MSGSNKHLNYQIKELIKIINKTHSVKKILNRLKKIDIPEYYIGAGSIAQSVWNYLSNFPIEKGINDIDIAYFDAERNSYEDEDKIIKILKNELSDINIKLDIKNQARVHEWYRDYFGYDIKPITSLEDAINRWPTTSTAIGIRKQRNEEYIIYAPYGLNDLFSMTVRANKFQITKDIYETKVKRWISIWPGLKIIPWDG